jgi:hypothetical protein
MGQMDLADGYIIFHPTSAQYTLLSASQGNFVPSLRAQGKPQQI